MAQVFLVVEISAELQLFKLVIVLVFAVKEGVLAFEFWVVIGTFHFYLGIEGSFQNLDKLTLFLLGQIFLVNREDSEVRRGLLELKKRLLELDKKIIIVELGVLQDHNFFCVFGGILFRENFHQIFESVKCDIAENSVKR